MVGWKTAKENNFCKREDGECGGLNYISGTEIVHKNKTSSESQGCALVASPNGGSRKGAEP